MMKVNFNKYFEIFKERDIFPSLISISNSKSTSVSILNGEVVEQKIADGFSISSDAIYQGKRGVFSTDHADKDTPLLMADKIIESARFGKEYKAEYFLQEKMKYHRLSINKNFVPATLKELRDCALKLYSEFKSLDSRITTCSIDISMTNIEQEKANSYGIKAKYKINAYLGSISFICKDKDDTRSGSCSFYSLKDLKDIEEKAHKEVHKALHEAIDFFYSKPIKSKRYKVIFSPESFSSLLSFYLPQLSALSMQKHLSCFEGKKGEQIASKALSIKVTPFEPSINSSLYDYSLVPTKEFDLIKSGVLQDYLYSLESANNEGVKPNGCGTSSGEGAVSFLTIRKGRSTLDQLFTRVKNGLFITGISGLNSGIDEQTLQFSLPCQGYEIKDGKKDRAVSMIIVTGNLKDVMNNIVALADDVNEEMIGKTPSVLVKNVAISGQ